MPAIFERRFFLVFPDGLVQETEEEPTASEGDLIPSDRFAISDEPQQKYRVARVVDDDDAGELPHIRRFYLEAF